MRASYSSGLLSRGSVVKDTCKLTPPSGPLWTLMNINYADRESARPNPLLPRSHRREQIRPFLPCISLLFEAEAFSRALTHRALKLGKSAAVPGSSWSCRTGGLHRSPRLLSRSIPHAPSSSIIRNYSTAGIRKTAIVHCHARSPSLSPPNHPSPAIPYIVVTQFLI